MTLAVNGITSMSTRPLQMIVILGFLTFLFSIGLFISCIVDWANGAVVAGWTTTVASTCLIGGITLFIPGNYWGIYREDLYGEQRASAVYRGFHDPAGCRG